MVSSLQLVSDCSDTDSSNSMKLFYQSPKDIDLAFFFFQYTFTAASVTIVAGTLAERCQMAAYLCYSIFLTGFVYPGKEANGGFFFYQ